MSLPTTHHELVQNLNNIPSELRSVDNGWYMYDFDSDNPKAPLNTDGSFAKWSSGDNGVSFDEAVESLLENDKFDQIGYRFTDDDPYFYIDFDGCLEDEFKVESVKDWCVKVKPFSKDTYIEYSSSGTGIHVLYKGQIPEWWEDAEVEGGDHEGVEIFDSRMCIFTGLEVGDNDDVMHIDDLDNYNFADDLLLKIYQKVEGESPPDLQETNDYDEEQIDTTEINGDVTEALEKIDPHDIEDILWSEYQGKRNSTFEEWNPEYRNSSSGRSLIRNTENNTWFDFKYGHEDSDDIFGILRLYAAERGWLDRPVDDLDGEDWVNVYKDFKSKCLDAGIKLPELGSNSIELDSDAGWEDIQQNYAESNNNSERGKCDLMATQRLLDDSSWMTTIDTDELYYYEDGIYTEDGEQMLRKELTEGLMHEYRPGRLNTIDDMLRGRTLVDRDEIGSPDPYVTVKNGVLDVVDRELVDYSPEFNAIRKLPVEYDEDAECPTFIGYIEDVIPEEEERKKVQEYLGYTLFKWDIPFQKALFIVGPTNSGKSTLLDVINMFHDDDAVAHVTPQELSEERFAGYDLYQSWVNIRNDIPSETVENVGMFKETIAGDEIRVEQKNQNAITIEPKAKHVYAGNQLPSASVDDQAFYERVLLLSMPKTIPRENQDRDLLRKISNELSGVLNWALDGLDRLMKNDQFTADKSASETEEMWQKWSSSAKRFIHECVEVTGDKDDDVVGKSTAMRVFEEYVERRGMPSASKGTLTKTLTSNADVTHTNYGGPDGSGVYEGVRLTELGDALLDVSVDPEDQSNQEEVKRLLQ